MRTISDPSGTDPIPSIRQVKNMKRISLIVLLCAIVLGSAPLFAQIAVIANKSVSITSLDAGAIKDLYSLDSKNIGSAKAVLFDVRASSPAKIKFYETIGITPDAAKKLWLKAKLTGAGEAPIAISEEEMVEKVASTPGAVGYVSAGKVTGDVIVLLKAK